MKKINQLEFNDLFNESNNIKRSNKVDIKCGDQEILFNNIESNSIDAIITDPPYNLKWEHKIETKVNFEKFLENSYRVLKENGFLVYFGQEPTMSIWNYLAMQKFNFNYLAEVIWYKRNASNIFQFPLRVHEKIMIFTKGKGALNKATIEWIDEKKELIEYTTKANILREFSGVKKLIKENKTLEDIKKEINFNKDNNIIKIEKTNDEVHKKIKVPRKPTGCYLIISKMLTTLWGCSPHNKQKMNKEEYNIKHPTVKPVQIIERLLEMTTKENQTVLDVFMGSGTTGVACNNLNRNFIGFEIYEDYFNIAKNRLKL